MKLEFEPASFRDPDARVFLRGGEVYRVLNQKALSQWRTISAKPFYQREVAGGRLIDATEAAFPDLPSPWAGVVKAETIPVISYPYEWSFGMLKAAARLQLELTLAALDDQVTLKDATPYNIQWRGTQPVFIDITSFEERERGSLWVGYRQFCEGFLNPLILAAVRHVDFRPWMRGSLEGVPSRQLRRLLRPVDLTRPSIFKHVYLHARTTTATTAPSLEIQREVAALGIDTSDMVRSNLKGLLKFVDSLEVNPPSSDWTEYEHSGPYSAQDREAKDQFVSEVVESTGSGQVLDLGCNTGIYSKIAASSDRFVVAVDSDGAVIERLFNDLSSSGERRILPLVWDFADPSPGLGWRGRERRPLRERISPDLILALAVVHHLTLGRNIPLEEVIDELAAFGADLLIEFPTSEDPMVRSLLARKRTHSETYELPLFERFLQKSFVVSERRTLPSGTRHLFLARPRR